MCLWGPMQTVSCGYAFLGTLAQHTNVKWERQPPDFLISPALVPLWTGLDTIEM